MNIHILIFMCMYKFLHIRTIIYELYIYNIWLFTDPEFFNKYFATNITSSEVVGVMEKENNGIYIPYTHNDLHTHILIIYTK